MATQVDPKELDVQEQLAKIRRDFAEINQREVQTKLEFPKFIAATILASISAGVAIGGLAVSYFSG